MLGRKLRLFLWAQTELVFGWVLVRMAPFRWVARQLGHSGAVAGPPLDADAVRVAEVAWAIAAVSRRTPIPYTCLMQAVAAQRMLRRRRIPSTAYLAMAADTSNGRSLAAHAWVRCGTRVVVGACDESRFRVIARFA